MKKIVFGLVLLLVTGICATAQTIKIKDISEPSSYVTLEGTVTFSKQNQDAMCYLMATNEDHSLLLKDVAVRITITRPDGQTAEFGFVHSHSMQDLVKHGGKMPVAMGSCPFGTDFANNQKATKKPAGATAKVVTARFSDGFTWGNPRELEGIDSMK